MLRLLRLTSLKYPLVFGLSCGPRERCMNGAKRVGSGRPIDSTLMTSAPWSARILVPYGPANTHVRSRTRTPSRLGVLPPLHSWVSFTATGEEIGRAHV